MKKQTIEKSKEDEYSSKKYAHSYTKLKFSGISGHNWELASDSIKCHWCPIYIIKKIKSRISSRVVLND